jgi:class 3 adenylate cyclase/tetratricopeptide (TPR) repeat protein
MSISTRCTNCGIENAAEARFCNQCATPLSRICPKCTHPNAPDAKFCDECAAPLTSDVSKSSARTSSAPSIEIVSEPTAPIAADGERKTVTALFADIKGSTELEQDLDPEEARAIVDPALKLMIDAVRRYDGYIVQSTGDGIFALFGAPVAHEDHPQRALYAALRMQEELKRYSARLREAGNLPIEARVGVNTGEVVVRSISTGGGHTEYTPIGHTTNLASRMQALAPTGSIAISEQTRKLVEGYFALKPLGPTRVKGVTEPVNVYEVTGLGPLRTRLQRSAGRGLSKFVGRDRETEAMRNAADLARAGRGQIVAAMAEAGTGKSRLFFEFKAVSQSGWMVLETFSVSHGKASAFLPVIDLLHGYFKIAGSDDERMRREKVNGKVLTLDRSLEDTIPYLFALLGISEDGEHYRHWEQTLDRLDEYLHEVQKRNPLAQMDAQIRKRRTLDAIKRLLLRESLNQPLMVIFEDLHWIDDETQTLLNLLADSIGTAKILLLVNYRPEYSHQWGSKTYYTQLRLDPLGKDSAEEMLSALLGDNAELAPLKRVIIERTEGNPFFMEETVQVLLDEGALVRNGSSARLTKALGELKIPPTVQAILAARIDRLPPAEKDLLQVLAVIGREFPLSLVRAVASTSTDELAHMLDDLQLGEFIYEQPALGDVEYTFKHALTQEVAYNSVLMDRRRVLHDRAGNAIENLYADHLDDHLAELAHHFARSANVDKAIRYLTLAGRQSLDRYALGESQVQLQKGLELLNTLPESLERDARELDLASTLATVLWRTKGPGASETRDLLPRAAALAEKTGNLAQLIAHLNLIRVSAMLTGDHRSASPLADQIFDLAEREGGTASLSVAHLGKLQAHYYRGDLLGAEERFAIWRNLRDAGVVEEISDLGVIALATAGQCAWFLGHTEAAHQRFAEASAMARDIRDPFITATLGYFEATFYRISKDPERAEAAVTPVLASCEEHGMTSLGDSLLSIAGWARTQLGSTRDGLSVIRQGLAASIESGFRSRFGENLICLAEVQALDGMIDDALITIEQAFESNPQEMLLRPEILTMRGELRRKIGRADAAEADFRDAIALAQKMNAKMLEVRAMTSLARLLDFQGKRDQARAMLAEIYNWFTEGFDTADLKDAKALLDQLGE